MRKILVYGYGNPGRQDDGLGPALADKIEAEKEVGITVDSNYQLQIEDAETVSLHDVAVFVDASTECTEPFEFSELTPSAGIDFTTHSVSPASILSLCMELYSKRVKAYVLAVRGYSWNFNEKFSEGAESNLNEAYGFLKHKLNYLLHSPDKKGPDRAVDQTIKEYSNG